jgi:tetratricopeptide (TPR) repeat protein
LTDQTTRARTACALAVALAGSSDQPRAQKLIDEGLAELPRGFQYAPDRVSCLLGGSDVARHAGAAARAVQYVEDARRELQNAPYRSAIQSCACSWSSPNPPVADRRSEAIPVFQEAAARLNELGRDETATAGTLFNNWALTLNVIGRPLDAEPIYRKAIELSRTDDSDEGVSPMLLINYGRALRDLTRLDEAPRTRSTVTPGGGRSLFNQSLPLRVDLSRAGQAAQAAAMLDEVEPRLVAPPAGHIALHRLRRAGAGKGVRRSASCA